MSQFPLHPHHLDHLRRHMALLIARIEDNCASTTDSSLRGELETTCAFAHDLFDKLSLAEQAVAGHGDHADVVARLEERYRQGQARIDALHDQLEHIERPKRPDLEHHPASGSNVGDAVADSFMNLS